MKSRTARRGDSGRVVKQAARKGTLSRKAVRQAVREVVRKRKQLEQA